VTLSRLTAALAVTVALGLGACATSIPADQVRAPQPTKPVDLERFYSGRWLEVARLPMGITDGCVAAATDYVIVSPTRVDLRDTCRQGGVDGKERAVGAAGVILDPGFNAKLRAPYFAGFVTWEYWVLDYADDYSWFISADPRFEKLWIYTRRSPSPSELSALVDRARALGYDVSRLEFPETAS
jgi:apolipoprotein D and lipocalin family protein